MSVTEIVIGYLERGWQIVPIPYKEKGPKIKNWPKITTTVESVKYMGFDERETNIGLILGERTQLVCVDLDTEEAKLLAPVFLPPTDAVFGRQGNERSHWFYHCQKPGDGKKWTIPQPEVAADEAAEKPKKHHTVELLSTGNQVVVGPSVNEDGLVYDVIDKAPTAISYNELVKACQALHRAVLAKMGIEEKPETPKPTPRPRTAPTDGFVGNTDLLTILNEHGADILGNGQTSDGCNGYYVTCPKAGLHSTKTGTKDTMVWVGPNGGWQAKCFHASCGITDWKSFKEALDYGWAMQADSLASVDVSGLMAPRADIRQNNGFHTDAGIPASPQINGYNEPEEPHEIDCDHESVPVDGFPEECLYPPGIIGDIVRFNLETAKYPQPEHALAAALAMMSLITGRRVADQNDTRTNLMIIALGPTRSGKEHPRQINKVILERLNELPLFEEKVASHSALHGFLGHNNIGLLMNDEFGDFLSLARSTRGGNTQPAQIISAMLKLYSSSSSFYKADRYADNQKQITINQPHLVLYGTSTGEVFWQHVTPEYLSGGFFGRTLIFENRGYVDPTRNRRKDPPENLLRQIEGWLELRKKIDPHSWMNITPTVVPHDSEALERYAAHEHEISLRRKKETAIRAALWSGTAEITSKLALLFACSRSRNPLQIKSQDVDLAIKLSNWLTRRKVALSGANVSENTTESNTKRVLNIIKSFGRNGITKNFLTKKTQWLRAMDRSDALRTLEEAEQISIRLESTKGRPRFVIVASNLS